MPDSKELETSFDFPERLEFWANAKYERELWANVKAAQKHGELTASIQYGLVFQAALKAGLYLNWKSISMPDPDTDDLDENELSIILWAGEEMYRWVEAQKHVPKVSIWTRVLARMGATLPRNSRRPGNVNGGRASYKTGTRVKF